MSLSTGPLGELKKLAREHSLPSNHGMQRFLMLVEQSSAGVTSFIRNLGLGLVSRTDNPAVDIPQTIKTLDEFFRSIDIQSNMTSVQAIAQVTRHCMNKGLQVSDILYAAQGPAESEVKSILQRAGKFPVKPTPFPTAPQSSSGTPGKGNPIRPTHGPTASPLGPYLPGNTKKKP